MKCALTPGYLRQAVLEGIGGSGLSGQLSNESVEGLSAGSGEQSACLPAPE